MGGPLDRWLRRAPLEPLPLQAPGDAQESASEQPRSQQTAEPPHQQEQNEQERQKGRSGTLHDFLIKRDADEDAQEAAEELEASQRRRKRQRRLVGCSLDWQLTGRMGAAAAAAMRHASAAGFRQQAILESHAWQRAVLGGAPLSPEEAGAIQCVQFDSLGEVLVAGSEHGVLTVHSTAQLLAPCTAGRSGRSGGTHVGAAATSGLQQQAMGTADPLLVLDTCMPRLQAVRWNPSDENVVGAVAAGTRQLHLYDLQHTQGQPKQVLSAPPQQSTAAGGSTAVGLTDLAFFGGSSSSSGGAGAGSSSSGGASGGGGGGGGGYVVLASGNGGQLFLWDARAKSAPSATLAASQGSGAMYAVQLAPDQQVVLAGTQSGEVKLWDLRGGSSSTLRFGGTVHHHPLLASVNLRHALTGVPGLADQTSIPASAVHSMQLDPCDPRRLAFHLGCGWSGVLHLHSGAITHLHAPANLAYPEAPPGAAAAVGDPSGADGPSSGSVWPAVGNVAQILLWASTAAPSLHRQAAWTPDGCRYCVPSRRDDTLLLLDFSPSPEAGCYAQQAEEQQGQSQGGAGGGFVSAGSLGEGRQRRPAAAPAVPVALSQAAMCVGVHPAADVMVAGGMSSCLSLVGLG